MPHRNPNPNPRPIEWMFVKARKTVRFAEGDDLERVLIIPAREDEDNTFPEDITEYYTCTDDEDVVESEDAEVVMDENADVVIDEEEARACDFDRIVSFAAAAVRRRRGVAGRGAERLWAAAQY